jgi:hypothetical protein
VLLVQAQPVRKTASWRLRVIPSVLGSLDFGLRVGRKLNGLHIDPFCAVWPALAAWVLPPCPWPLRRNVGAAHRRFLRAGTPLPMDGLTWLPATMPM